MKKKIVKNLQYILICTIFFIDFISKKYISNNFSIGQSVKLTKFINFTYIKNFGFAFNIFSHSEQNIYKFIIFVISIIVLLIFTKLRFYKIDACFFSYPAIIGGSFGNLIDRIITGSVTDFISIHINEYYFPIFNIADLSICIGTLLTIMHVILKRYKKSNFIKKH